MKKVSVVVKVRKVTHWTKYFTGKATKHEYRRPVEVAVAGPEVRN